MNGTIVLSSIDKIYDATVLSKLHDYNISKKINSICCAKLDITNDAFIRTTDPEHIAVVQELLQKLYAKGEIEHQSPRARPVERRRQG